MKKRRNDGLWREMQNRSKNVTRKLERERLKKEKMNGKTK
jgi:hypothetical protein